MCVPWAFWSIPCIEEARCAYILQVRQLVELREAVLILSVGVTQVTRGQWLYGFLLG